MSSPTVAQVLWDLVRFEWTASEWSVLVAVLACNLGGYAPTRKDLIKHLAAAERTQRDAHRSLLDGRKVLVERMGRLALVSFAHLLPIDGEVTGPPRGGPPPVFGEPPHHPGDTRQESGESRPELGERSPESRANAVKKEKSGGAFKAPQRKMDPAQLKLLVRFAETYCKLRSAAAAVNNLVANYGEAQAIEALEQYAYAYIERGRTAKNPPGQMIAWCKAPETMDPLPPLALRFAAWADVVMEVDAARASARIPQPRTPARILGPAERADIAAWDAYLKRGGPKPTEEMRIAAEQERALAEKKSPATTPLTT